MFDWVLNIPLCTFSPSSDIFSLENDWNSNVKSITIVIATLIARVKTKYFLKKCHHKTSDFSDRVREEKVLQMISF